MEQIELQSADQKSQHSHVECAMDVSRLQPTAVNGGTDVGAVEKSVVRKLDLNLMPLLMFLYILSFLDRSNIGNADTAGMGKDLHLSDDQYQWLLTIFYITFILFQWMMMLWKILPPHIYVTCTLFTWGTVAFLQGATKNWAGMMALRALLGCSEAGFSGIPYFLSFFYLRDELGKRIGFFLASAPLATTFAGALAYGLTSTHTSIAGWRLLFFVECAPTILMAPVAWFFIPDKPHSARFLNREEKDVAYHRGVRQVGDKANMRIGAPEWSDILPAVTDPKNVIQALMMFSNNVAFSSISVFLPTIIKEMGYTSINAQGLTCPPYFLSFFVCIISTQIADRLHQRGFTLVVLSSIGGTGYLMLAIGKSVGVRYAGVFLAAAGVFPSVANLLPWNLNNQRSDTKRGVGMIMLHLIGQCGPLLGTRLYPKSQGPYYVKGMSICAAFAFFSATLALCMRIYLAYENKKMDRAEAARTPIASEPTKEGWGEETAENPHFRYIL